MAQDDPQQLYDDVGDPITPTPALDSNVFDGLSNEPVSDEDDLYNAASEQADSKPQPDTESAADSPKCLDNHNDRPGLPFDDIMTSSDAVDVNDGKIDINMPSTGLQDARLLNQHVDSHRNSPGGAVTTGSYDNDIASLSNSGEQPADADCLEKVDNAVDDGDFLREHLDDFVGMAALLNAQEGAFMDTETMKCKRRAEQELAAVRSTKKVSKKRKHSDDSDNEASEHYRKRKKTLLWERGFVEIDEEGEAAQNAYRIQAENYYKKQKNGKLSSEEEMQFLALNQREQSRRNKITRDWELCNAERDYKSKMQAENGEEEVDEDASSLFVSSSANFNQPRTLSRNKTAATDSPDRDMPDGFNVNLDNDGTAQAPIKETNAPKKSRRKPKSASKTGAGRKQRGPNMANVPSMWTSNVFRDAQALEEGEEDEGRLRLTGRRKQEALKTLIASLPQEHQDLARADKTALDKAARLFDGHGSCSVAPDGGWLIKGMKSSLRHFQMLGSSWMRKRENSSQKPRGGLIADEMGMGKTIMTITNIVNGKPPANTTRECKATLIIVPSSIYNQWYDEIEKHTDGSNGLVIKWKSTKGSGMRTSNDRQLLCNAFIVLCTYHEVTKSCPKIIFPPHIKSAEDRETWLSENHPKHRGLLHRIPWLRVVVDEAHCIKNHLTHTSLAIREITAVHRWAITGTPIHNSPKELYPYFKFLEVPHTGNYRIFCENYDVRGSRGQTRLLSMLNTIMLRRTYADKIMGQALVKLPQTSTTEYWVEFNVVEKFVYNLIHERIQENIRNMAQAGTLGKLTYHHVLTMILRLRQASSHLLLVEQTMRDLLTKADLDELRTLCDAHERPMDQRDRESLLDVRRMLKNQEKWKAATDEPEEAFMRHIEGQETTLMTLSTGEAYGLTYNFKSYLDNLKAGSRHEELRESLRCSKCSADPAKAPRLTDCSHIYCTTCIRDTMLDATTSGMPVNCGTCHKSFASSTAFDPNKALDEDANPEQPTAKGKKGKRPSSKNENPLLFDMPHVNPLPSAKTRAIKAQLLNWVEVDAAVKAIIFTQFLPMIGFLSKMCKAEGWPSFEFCGNMSIEARDEAIKVFDMTKGPCIMIATLRTGGVGLNLTMASKVIIMDPWWNSSVEMQAFGRVFRIGQKEKTSLTRLFAKDTVDTKMHDMQEEKTAAIQAIMGGGGDLNATPTMSELMQLFGLGDKENGFILSEDSGNDKKRTMLEDDAYLQWNKADGNSSKRPRFGD